EGNARDRGHAAQRQEEGEDVRADAHVDGDGGQRAQDLADALLLAPGHGDHHFLDLAALNVLHQPGDAAADAAMLGAHLRLAAALLGIVEADEPEIALADLAQLAIDL